MKHIFLVMAAVLFIGFSANAQLSEEVKKITPDLPGDIVVDFGFNFERDSASSWFRSRSFALYFVKSYDLGNSIQFRPGIGWNSEKISIRSDANDDITIQNYHIPLDTGLRDFKMAVNYIDVPVELRFNLGGNDRKGWFIALGGSAGLRFESHSKIEYRNSDGTVLKTKIRSNTNFTKINNVRYGASGRIGVGQFSLFYKHYFSDLYKASESKYFTVGISLSGF